jgi:Cu+-exporting ATPase
VNGVVVAVLGIADQLRPEAPLTVTVLKEMGVAVWMVTGDNRRTASAIAAKVGIPPENVIAEVLPANKAESVRDLQANGYVVAMVGDGVNDSPALAQANLGIAVGAGADIAIEAAGMVLQRSSLTDVVLALDLSRVICRRIILNFCWAIGYNLLLVPMSAGVFYPCCHVMVPPMLAGAAMACSSVSVVVSSLLLNYYTPPIVDEQVLNARLGAIQDKEQGDAVAKMRVLNRSAATIGSAAFKRLTAGGSQPLRGPLLTKGQSAYGAV